MQRNRNRTVPLIAVLTALLSCSAGLALAGTDVSKVGAKPAETARQATDYGKVVEGPQIKIELTNKVIVEGESAQLAITLKNRDKKSRHVSVSSPDYEYVLYVKGPDGKTMRIHRDRNVFTTYFTVDIKPGETYVDGYDTLDSYASDQEGAYQLTITREIIRLKKPGTAIVTSNPVVLRVIQDRGEKGTPESTSPRS
jgi:hypothetical protein